MGHDEYPPDDLILVPVPKAILLLTPGEFQAGLRRGKRWKRSLALAQRTTDQANSHPGAGADQLVKLQSRFECY